jgi:HSP20 family protein
LTTDDVNIEATETSLTLSGKRKTQAPEGYRVHRRERASLEFARAFEFPAKVDLEKVTATMKDGVLRIELAKQAQTRPRQISIKAS